MTISQLSYPVFSKNFTLRFFPVVLMASGTGENVSAMKQERAPPVITLRTWARDSQRHAGPGTDPALCGGIYNGTSGWPGLEKHQLVDGRYLAHSVDFRDVYAEILSRHLGCSHIDQILPGHSYQPLGLF